MDITRFQRLDEYDVAKGIGILLVIIGHALPNGGFWRNFIYSFHMPLFFFLSGLVMKAPQGDLTFKNMLFGGRRLILHYVFWSILFIMYDCIAGVTGIKEFGISGLAIDIYQSVTFFGVSVLWFLSTLILGKWIVILVCNKCHKQTLQMIFAIMMFIVGSVMSLLLPDGLLISGISRLIYYSVCMLIRTIVMSSFILFGFAINVKMKIGVNNCKILTGRGTAILGFIFLFSLCRYTQGIDYHYSKIGLFPITFITSVAGIVLVLSCSCIVVKLKYLKAVLLFFGQNSLFIMATHEYFGIKVLINMLLRNAGLSDGILVFTSVVVLILTEILLVLIVKPWIDRLINFETERICMRYR